MKTILTKAQAQQFLDENWKLNTLNFKWTISKGRDTYGYNICTLRDMGGNKIASTCGGGYDMQGTALGNFINSYFSNELKKLTADRGGVAFAKRSGFYGLTHYNPKAKSYSRRYLKRATEHTRSYVDGASGFDCMRRILAKIGFKMNFVQEKKNCAIYTLSV
jgi:hypothetical protein|tara:strand:+ start:115 stop:600 length:486 start_codon:yes stop_codon:yes gene_type:complete